MSHSPNPAGKGPKVKPQGKAGPITGKMTSVSGKTKPFTFGGKKSR